MKVLIGHLSGRQLDWAVGHYLGAAFPENNPPAYTTDWAIAGPVLDAHPISVLRVDNFFGFPSQHGYDPNGDYGYAADYYPLSEVTSVDHQSCEAMYCVGKEGASFGHTFLEAAMRSLVLHLAGRARIDVPDNIDEGWSPKVVTELTQLLSKLPDATKLGFVNCAVETPESTQEIEAWMEEYGVSSQARGLYGNQSDSVGPCGCIYEFTRCTDTIQIDFTGVYDPRAGVATEFTGFRVLP